MVSSMSTVFKFAFEKAGENINAQTGDWLAILLTALFAIVAVSAIVFAFTKSNKHVQMKAGHSAVKEGLKAKTIIALVVAALAVTGAIVSAANTPIMRAFAGANADGVEYKDFITATVHEDSQTVTFEGNYFKNTDEGAIHIDNSRLELSEEAKEVLGDFELRLEAMYADGTTRVFNDMADAATPYLPHDQYELKQNNTRDIIYTSNLTYEMGLKLCEIDEAFTLVLNPAQCVTVTYSKGDATSGEPPHSQTVSKSSEPGVMQTITKAPGRGSLAKSGYTFVNWNTKQDGTGTSYNEGDAVNPADTALTLYPQWENTSGYTIKFENDGKGIAKEKGKPEPIGDLTLTIPIETSYTINDSGEITFTKGGQTLYVVETSADQYISYSKWERKGEAVTSGTIEDDDPFKVSFTYDEITITYQGAYPEDPHGTMKPNGSASEEVTEYEEKFQPANPTNAQAPKGVTAIQKEEKAKEDQYLYYFVNWTDEEGNPVPVPAGKDPKEIIPTEPTGGWTDLTFVVHYATPKAVYSENSQTGEKLMKFYYDEEPHLEAKDGDKNNKYKFYVNESKFEYDDEGTITKIEAPSWFTPAFVSSTGKVTAYPTPLIWPTKVEFDSGFKDFKNLKSTDMWFMDATAIQVLEAAASNNGAAGGGATGTEVKTRQIQSIVGLENVYTENIESTAIMFGAGSPLINVFNPFAQKVTDSLQSLDLSSWTNLPKLTGQMTGMFAGCNNLAELKLPLDAESNFGELAYETTAMFFGCSALSSITINNDFCGNSEFMRFMFANCSSLLEFKLGQTATFGENAEYVGKMFQGCTNLNTVDLSSVATDVNANGLFEYCNSLIKIVLPQGFEPTSSEMGLEQGREWYYYVASEGTYEKITEEQIGEKKGGTFTRLAPKAVYNAAASTLTFYYDYETHSGEGEPFIINNAMPTLNSTLASVFPSWYDVNIYIDDEKVQYVKDVADLSLVKGKKVTSNIQLKAPAEHVVFHESFSNLKDSDSPLNLIFGWFMADSNPLHANCLHDFSSVNSKGEIVSNKFAYFPTEEVTMWACPFGGFSMEVMCAVFDAFSKQAQTSIQKTLCQIGYSGEDLAYYSGADTYSGAVSLDLQTLKVGTQFVSLGLVANSPSLTKIVLPKASKDEEAVTHWAFMNCSSLTEIDSGFMEENWYSAGIYKMFYGCSSLEELDLTKFNYVFNEKPDMFPNRQFYTFADCNKLYNLSITGKAWDYYSRSLNMKQCSLPEGIWHYEKMPTQDLSTSDIPVGNNGPMDGLFHRDPVTTGKTVKFEVDGTGGSISPTGATTTIYGDTDFVWTENDIIINGQTIKAIPDENNTVKQWKLNDARINKSGFAEVINTIKYDEADSFTFKVTFVDESLKPKAVYKENDKTFTFYYDDQDHSGDGVQVFDVYTNTHFKVNASTKVVDAKLPAWYDYTLSSKFDTSSLNPFVFNTQLKIDATKVIFDKTFVDYDDLESISMWFMGDHSGKQTFKEFYSVDEAGNQVPGFSNINTTSLKDVSFAFGGFSMTKVMLDTPEILNTLDNNVLNFDPLQEAQINRLNNTLSKYAVYDSFGTSLQNIDISTFDQEHNVSNYSGLFCNCTSLYSINLGNNIDDANITKMDAMFYNCESLGLDPGQTDIIKNLDKLNTSNVTSMNLLFFGDYNIKEFNLSNFSTEKTIDLSKGLSQPLWNTRLMFWDCTRLSSISINSQVPEGQTELVGWTAPLSRCGLLDNYDPYSAGQPNVWSNTSYPGQTWKSTSLIPYDIKYYPPKPEVVYTGTFTRKALPECKTHFETSDKTKGKVNGQDSVVYSYIQTDNVRLDQNNPSDMLSDNFRITPEPTSADYKFDHWELGEGFGEDAGKVVTLQDNWMFESAKEPGKECTFVAVFEEASKSAKAVYTKPTEANGTGQLTFYYDSQSHEADNVEVFEVKTDTNVHNLPAWYEESGIDPWVEGDDRPIPYFSDKIDTGADHPETIVISFDKSFSTFKQLTSLSCWFMPAIDRNNQNALYHPFKFNKANFQYLDNINTESIYNLWYMFGGHENANDYSGSHTTEIDLSNFDPSGKLKNLDGMFANCADLTTLTLSGKLGANCTSMSHTFFNCRALTGEYLYAALKGLVTARVEDMSYMFASYKNNASTTPTDSVTLQFPENFNLNAAKTIEGMFAGYTNTKKLIITDNQPKHQKLSQCTDMSYMFANNHSSTSALENIEWKNFSWFNTASAESTKGMFMNNTSIKTLDFITLNDDAQIGATWFNTDTVTDMSYMFSGCTSLSTLEMQRIYKNTFITSSVSDASHMFENTGINKVKFGENADIYASMFTNTARMFSGCSNLESVELDRSSSMGLVAVLKNATYMFENCPSLKSVNLSNLMPSADLIPENEDDPASEMVPSVYNMFANTDADGNVTLNSAITEFTITHEWTIQMDQTGLATTDSQGEPVLWYYIQDWTVTGYPTAGVPTQPVTLPDEDTVLPGYGTFTKVKPHNFTVSSNNNMWGEVQLPNEASGVSQYMGSATLTVVSGKTLGQENNVLLINLSNFNTPIPVVAVNNKNQSDFAGWQVSIEGQEDPVTLELNKSITVNTDVDIQAVFENGLVPIYAYGAAEPSSPDDYAVMIGCLKSNEVEAMRARFEAMGITVGYMPVDGDFSKTEEGQAPWTKAEVVDKVKEVSIEDTMLKYDKFTSFAGWFKGLSNITGIEGIYSLNTKSAVDFTSMFEGCTSLEETLIGLNYDRKKGKFSISENTNTVNTTNMFKNCSSMSSVMINGITKIGECQDMFNGCSALTSIGLSDNFDKNLTEDLGLAEGNWCYSGQNTLSAYSSKEIQSKMKKAKDLGIGIDVYCLGKVSDTSKIVSNDPELGKITDNLKSGQFVDELTINYNNDAGLNCSAIRTDTALIVSFELKAKTEFLSKFSTTWSVTVNNKASDGNMFYEWDYNDEEIGNVDPVVLENNNDITAVFDVTKLFNAVYDGSSTEKTLTFYYDSQSHESEGVVIPVPKQWYKQSGGALKSPFIDVAKETTKVIFDSSVADYKSLFDTWCWFKEMNKLQSVEGLKNLKLTNVTNFAHMFEFCESLISVDFSECIGNKTPANFTSMFSYCLKMTEVDISSLYTDGVYIADEQPTMQMFEKCMELNSVSFGDKWINSPFSILGKGPSEKWVNEDDALSVSSDQFPNTSYAGSGTFKAAKYSASFVVNEEFSKYFDITSNKEIYFSDNLDASYSVDSNTHDLTITLKNKDNVTHEYPITVKRNNPQFKFEAWLINKEKLNPTGPVIDKDVFEMQASKDTNIIAAYYDKDNGTLTFAYDEDKHSGDQLTIQPDWEGEGSPFFKYVGGEQGVKKIIFLPSFKNYTDLVSLKSWFREFRGLTEIDGLENINTSYVTDFSNMFKSCTNLGNSETEKYQTINISSWNTANAENMQSMFDSCCKVKHFIFGNNFNTEKVQWYSRMFYDCNSLLELDLSSFSIGTQTADFPNIDQMLNELRSLKTLNLSVKDCRFNYMSEEGMYMHGGANNLSNSQALEKITANGKLNLNISGTWNAVPGIWVDPAGSDWNPKIINTPGVYIKCKVISFKSNEILAGKFENSNQIAFVPEQEYATVEVDPDDNTKLTFKMYIDGQAEPYAKYERKFNVTEGSTYNFDKWTFDPLPTEGKIVTDTTITACCTDVYSPKAVYTEVQGGAYNLTFYFDNQVHSGTVVDVPKQWGMAEYSDNYEQEWDNSPFAMGDLETLASKTVKVVFDDSFKNCKGIGSMTSWFNNFTKVESYEGLENVDTTCLGLDSEAGFKRTFANNISLKSIDVSGMNTKGDENNRIPACYRFSQMFYNCSSLESITFTQEGKDNIFCLNGYADAMFWKCKSLKSIDFTSMGNVKVDYIESMFLWCYGLESINLGHMDIPEARTVSQLVGGCYSLKSLQFSGTLRNEVVLETLFSRDNGVFGNWLVDGRKIESWKQPWQPGSLTRNDADLVKLTFNATGSQAENGVTYLNNWGTSSAVGEESGYVNEILVPKGTVIEYKDPSADIVLKYKDHTNYEWEVVVHAKDKTGIYKASWDLKSETTVDKPLELNYIIGERELLSDNPQAENNMPEDPQIEPQVDPDEPQADPSSDDENEDNGTGVLPLMAGLPFLAAFGFRKRLRGKHVKITK